MNYSAVLVTGVVLFAMAPLMKLGLLDFIVLRYERFHRFIRKNKALRVDREPFRNAHSVVYATTGVLVTVSGLTKNWIPFVVAVVAGVMVSLYINLSTRFFIYEDQQEGPRDGAR